MGDYDGMKGDDLRAELRDRGLPVSGTNDEMVARLEEDDAATEEPAADGDAATADTETVDAGAAPDTSTDADVKLLKHGGKVDPGGVRQFAGSVRRLTDDIADRLDAEVTQPLANFHADVNDPAGGPTVAAGRNIAAAVDGVRQSLRVLRHMAARLERDSTA